MSWFLFSLFIAIYIVLVILNFTWYLSKNKNKIFYYTLSPVNWLVQFIVLMVGLGFRSNYIENNELVFKIVFFLIVFILSIQIMFFVVVLVIELTKFIQDDSDFNRLIPKYQGISLITLLVSFLIMPCLIFGMFYDLWLEYAHITDKVVIELRMYDFIYFAFGINYSLPLSGALEDFQKVVNFDYYLRSLQFVHVISSKILELIVIGFIISKVTKLFEKDKGEFTFSNEIKKLDIQRNQKKITNEQYEKIVQYYIDRYC